MGLAAKVRHAPTLQQVARLDEYVQSTLWGVKPNLPFPVSLQVCCSNACCSSLHLLLTQACAAGPYHRWHSSGPVLGAHTRYLAALAANGMLSS